MLPSLAALDHMPYLRWRLVFLNDINRLPDSIEEAIDQEYFFVKKTSRVFSVMRIDQAYEQNNRVVKVDDGAIGIMDNERALLEWVLLVPYVATMVCESTNCSPQTIMKIQNHSKRNFARGELNWLKHSSTLKTHYLILQKIWWISFQKS